MSKSKDKFAAILESKDIKYERKKSFGGAIHPTKGKKLHYDFYLPEYSVLIEINKKQRFKKIIRQSHLYKFARLNEIKNKDVIKIHLAVTNNYYIMQIPANRLNKFDMDEFLQDCFRMKSHRFQDSSNRICGIKTATNI